MYVLRQTFCFELARRSEGSAAIREPGGGTMQDAFLPVQYAGPKFVASAITGEQDKRNTEQEAFCPLSNFVAGLAMADYLSNRYATGDLAR